MTTNEKIKENFKKLSGVPPFIISCEICEVVSIEGKTCTVKTVLNDVELDNVLLNTDVSVDGGCITPAVGSMVTVLHTDECNRFVVQYSELKDIQLKIGETTLCVNDKEIVLNAGENGGLCITPTLSEELDKLSKRVDGIIEAINQAVPGVQDGGTALQSTMKVKLATLTDKEDFSKIENKKIKH